MPPALAVVRLLVVAVVLPAALPALAGCVHVPARPQQDSPCVVPGESPHVQAAARAREAMAGGAVRVDVDGDGSVDLALLREGAGGGPGGILREELHASGGPSSPAAASVQETARGESRWIREAPSGRRSLEVVRRQRPDGSEELLIASTDSPADDAAPVTRSELLLRRSTGVALLTQGFDRDRDGFYGHSTQRITGRVRPWNEPGALRLPETTESCDERSLGQLRTALDLAVLHGARCVRELGESEGLAPSERRLRSLEWLLARARREIDFVCLPVPLCGAVDLIHVAEAWLGEGPAILHVGTHAFDPKRCGPLAATVGMLLRQYDPASFQPEDGTTDAFLSCLADAARAAPACEKKDDGDDEDEVIDEDAAGSTSGRRPVDPGENDRVHDQR